MKKIDHKSTFNGYNHFISEVSELLTELDQKHYLERKIKFLLDIRGYLKTNAIKGHYVEFGSYRSEMQYAAYQILKDNNRIERYIGLDTFEGEPKNRMSDNKLNLFDSEGDFNCDYNEVNDFVQRTMDSKGVLIQGDFRNLEVAEKYLKYENVAISVIDCNLLSSVEAAFDLTLLKIVEGGVILFDDFFYNISIMKEIYRMMGKSSKQFIQHNFYPPFAKSFIVIQP